MAGAPGTIGVAGAGTMGAGIAQLACSSGARTVLHDPIPDALERGLQQIRAQLERGVQRGRLTADQAERAARRLEPASSLEALGPCELVIEAVPESLELKRRLVEQLSNGVVAA